MAAAAGIDEVTDVEVEEPESTFLTTDFLSAWSDDSDVESSSSIDSVKGETIIKRRQQPEPGAWQVTISFG